MQGFHKIYSNISIYVRETIHLYSKCNNSHDVRVDFFDIYVNVT